MAFFGRSQQAVDAAIQDVRVVLEAAGIDYDQVIAKATKSQEDTAIVAGNLRDQAIAALMKAKEEYENALKAAQLALGAAKLDVAQTVAQRNVAEAQADRLARALKTLGISVPTNSGG